MELHSTSRHESRRDEPAISLEDGHRSGSIIIGACVVEDWWYNEGRRVQDGLAGMEENFRVGWRSYQVQAGTAKNSHWGRSTNFQPFFVHSVVKIRH